jgi:hypothetical protein
VAPAKLKRWPYCGIWKTLALPLDDVVVTDRALMDNLLKLAGIEEKKSDKE